jgi:L-alanine-DL-glutamate epimerase-like enolase superfamily enzyme
VKITDIKAEKVKLDLVKPFVVSLGTFTYCETVICKIQIDEGLYGIGEGSPATFVTGETADSVIGAIEHFKPNLIGLDPLAIEQVHTVMDRLLVRNGSAKAAIDIALYDIKGKMMKQPLYKVLGGAVNQLETDITIGIDKPDVMAAEAKEIVARGFKYIKVKAGLDPDVDIQVIKLIRETVGSGIHIKVDANQGWSAGDALRVMKEYEKYGVQAVEQPVPYWDVDGMAYIRSKAPVMIMADESCFLPQDAMSICKKNAADIINIKLMKCGGLYRGDQINSIAESANVRTMLGCMLESKVAITAGASLVAARKNFLYADADSFLYFKDCPRIQDGFSISGGTITLSEKPGLGIDVDI